MWYLLGGKHYADAAKLADSLGAEHKLPPNLQEVLSWQFAYHVTETRAPFRWINASLRAEITTDRLMTKAFMRYKMGQVDEAEELAKEAYKLKKRYNENTALAESLLDLLKENP